ncbi:MAG: M15 family metallopeptidase [Treponema sp.]|jgi:hypothetical protein|nr:M15 family metallopeptidase [Treponema sp.]
MLKPKKIELLAGLLFFAACAISFAQEDRNSLQRAEQVMKALAAAYPGCIGQAEFRGGDWAVPLRDRWYYYAGGRLLPEHLRGKAPEYDPQPFYNYLAELPAWKEPSPEEAERFRGMANNRNRNPPKRSQHFYDDLWRAGSRDESYARVKSLRFLGSSVMVHYSILEELALVEERILGEARRDPAVRAWVNGISTLDGWNWRSIADTQSRSFHAYGAAVDILPKSLGGRETYWLWAARKKPEWWAVSYSQRFHPPAAVVKAFESYGFIWGGKWLFFDTMHFEYRPEILILSGMPLSNLR